MESLLLRPDILKQALSVIHDKDLSAFDGFVFEALRFKPAFPYFFRSCIKATELASNTQYAQQIPLGTTVLAITHSAMFDENIYPDPNVFDHRRPLSNSFHFGHGIHECLGRHIGATMIPEIIRQILLKNNIQAAKLVTYGYW